MAGRLVDESFLYEVLEKKFAPPAWALLPGVKRSTGWSRVDRTADAIGMSLWPSRGLELVGFEIKCSRGDWMRELKDPEKAEPIFSMCHRWWIVLSSREIVNDWEIPSTWGVLWYEKGGLKQLQPSPLLSPKPLDYHFLAAILRAITKNYIPAGKANAFIKREVQDRLGGAKELWEREKKNSAILAKRIQDFETAAGFSIKDWKHEPGDIGHAVRLVMEGSDQIGRLKERLEDLKSRGEEIVAAITRILDKKE